MNTWRPAQKNVRKLPVYILFFLFAGLIRTSSFTNRLVVISVAENPPLSYNGVVYKIDELRYPIIELEKLELNFSNSIIGFDTAKKVAPSPTATATPSPTATATPSPTATATPSPTATPVSINKDAILDRILKLLTFLLGSGVLVSVLHERTLWEKYKSDLNSLIDDADWGSALKISVNYILSWKKFFRLKLVINSWKDMADNSEELLLKDISIVLKAFLSKFSKGSFDRQTLSNALSTVVKIEDSSFQKELRLLRKSHKKEPEFIRKIFEPLEPSKIISNVVERIWQKKYFNSFVLIKNDNNPFMPLKYEQDAIKAQKKFFDKYKDEMSKALKDNKVVTVYSSQLQGRTSFATWWAINPGSIGSAYFPIYIRIKNQTKFEDFNDLLETEVAYHLLANFYFKPQNFNKNPQYRKEQILKLFLNVFKEGKHIFANIDEFIHDPLNQFSDQQIDAVEQDISKLGELIKSKNVNRDGPTVRPGPKHVCHYEHCLPKECSDLLIFLDFENPGNESLQLLAKIKEIFFDQPNIKIVALLSNNNNFDENKDQKGIINISYDNEEMSIIFQNRLFNNGKETTFVNTELGIVLGHKLNKFISKDYIIRAGQGIPGKMFEKGDALVSIAGKYENLQGQSDYNNGLIELIKLLHIPDKLGSAVRGEIKMMPVVEFKNYKSSKILVDYKSINLDSELQLYVLDQESCDPPNAFAEYFKFKDFVDQENFVAESNRIGYFGNQLYIVILEVKKPTNRDAASFKSVERDFRVYYDGKHEEKNRSFTS